VLLLAAVAAAPGLSTACGKPTVAPAETDGSPNDGRSIPPGAACANVDLNPRSDIEECKALHDRAQVEAAEAFDAAKKDCVSAGDCILVSKRGCLNDCNGYAIARSSYPAWKTAFDRIGATTCQKYRDGNCLAKVPMAIPTCPMYRPLCEHGACVAR
jgi:hypothetical protein